MNQFHIDSSIYEQICKFGTYYNPVYKHYGGSANVVCDKCHQPNLNICIGYQQHDLCIPCVETITNELQRQSSHICPIAPYGYDSEGRIRTHWCTTAEYSRPKKVSGSDLDRFYRPLLPK